MSASPNMASEPSCDQICDAGIFHPDTRFELVWGEIIEMPNPTRPHYWVLNIPDDLLEVCTDPAGGEYRRTEIYKRGRQGVTPQQLSGATFTIEELLG